MAGNVQIGESDLKKTWIKIVGAVIVISMTMSGCKKSSGLEEEYLFSEGAVRMASSQEEGITAPLFASELCVITGDTQDGDTSLTAQAGALFNVSGNSVIYSKNAYEQLYPASITKVMTALIALEEGDLSDQVTVTDASVITEAGATLAGIKPGDVLTMEQLLYGLMMPSGNDAANAIAVHMSDSVENFAEKMNAKARELGATHTHFMNPSGLSDENHYTTAYDLYLIFNEALKIPKFREIIGTSSYTADYINSEGGSVSTTWNVGNWYQKGDRQAPDGVTVKGGKTGTTQAAGYCLIMASDDSQGKEYISVVLKAGSRNELYDNMTEIISKIVN